MRLCVRLCIAALAAPGLAAPVINLGAGFTETPAFGAAPVANLTVTGDAAIETSLPAAPRTLVYWTTADLRALSNTHTDPEHGLLREGMTQPSSAVAEADAWFTIAQF